jgi:hypothetical protein
LESQFSLDKAPILVSVLSLSVLVLSVVYDFGFLFMLGTNFYEVPTNITDHVRSSLTWLPMTIILFFAAYILELLNRRIEGGKTEEELIQESPSPKFTAWFRESPKYGFIAFAFFIPLSAYFGVDYPIQAWMFSFLFIWLLIHNFLFHHRRIYSKTTKDIYLLTRWLPALLWFVLCLGAIAGNKVKTGSSKEYLFKLEKTEVRSSLVRSYDKFYLLWNEADEKVEFLNTGKVVSFAPTHKKESEKQTEPAPENDTVD